MNLEPLEGRCLLAGINFATGFGAASGLETAEAVAVDTAGNSYVTGSFNGTVNIGSISLTAPGQRDIYVAKFDTSGNAIWAKEMGSNSSTDGNYGRGIALDPSGNVIVSGFYNGTGSFGSFTLTSAGGRDAFVEKLDNSGNVLWAKSFGSTGTDLGHGVAVDGSGNVYNTGSFQGSVAFGGTTLTSPSADAIYVTKLDGATGNAVWATQAGGAAGNSGFSIAVNGAGNSYSTGDFAGSASFGSTTLNSRGDLDSYVEKIDTNGNVVWAQQFGGSGHDDGTGVAVDPNGNVYATGDFRGQGTFGGVTLNSAGENDAYVARLDGAGNVVWAKSFGGTSFDSGFSVGTDRAGNVYSTGYYAGNASFGGVGLSSANGSLDMYVVRQDSSGNVTSAQSYGSAANDVPFQLALGGPKGSLLSFAGSVGEAINFGTVYKLPSTTTAFLAQLDTGIEPGSNFNKYGYTQIAVYRPSQGFFIIQQPGGAAPTVVKFGDPSQKDLAIPADYDGNGQTQLAVYRPANGYWIIQHTNGKPPLTQFGDPAQKDIPAPGDYDGNGQSLLTVFRPSRALWIIRHNDGSTTLTQFGDPAHNDLPAPGDYDGVGHTQLAVYRPSAALWIVRHDDGSVSLYKFGDPAQNDQAAPGDYDGVGHTQLAVWRPSQGIWLVNHAGGNPIAQFGERNFVDIPTQSSAVGIYYAGQIPGFAAGGGFSAGAGFSVTAAPSPAASAPAAAAPTAAASSSRAAALGVRPSVVVGQGSTATTRSAWLSALDHLYGGSTRPAPGSLLETAV